MDFGRIDMAGVELEGGWTDRPPSNLIGDGSISLREGNEGANGQIINYVGEIPSPPFKSPTEMFDWMKLNYPQHTNSSCGMHVHTSFKSQNSYVRIMDRAFFEYIRAGLLDWGQSMDLRDPRFFARLSGSNTYCKNEYNPMGQVRYKDKGPHRYSILNYCHGRYKTVELRALPLFTTYDEAVAAIAAYFELVEAWLKKPPRGLKRIKRAIQLKAEPYEAPSQAEVRVDLADTLAQEEMSVQLEGVSSVQTVEV